MDQGKIGDFIARKRKELELTQMQFAELVGVSNKTVSKWETGARMPDVAILQDVCGILKITVNELLAGEELSEYSETEYMKKTEDNVIGLMQEVNEIKDTKKGGLLGVLCSIPVMLCAVVLTIVHRVGKVNLVYFLDIPTLFYMLGLFLFISGITGAFPKYIAGYKCLFTSKKYRVKEMDQVICTLEYARRLIWIISFFIIIVNVMAINLHYEHFETIGPFLAGIVTAPLYAIIIEFVHSYLLYQCRLRILEMRHSSGNNENKG
ncbi:MAG: helix-turn-helix domain-containing protein [Eubacterium sp.]|nr:helix-turn-helix domain-containing protein [Eubacterium sp.]